MPVRFSIFATHNTQQTNTQQDIRVIITVNQQTTHATRVERSVVRAVEGLSVEVPDRGPAGRRRPLCKHRPPRQRGACPPPNVVCSDGANAFGSALTQQEQPNQQAKCVMCILLLVSTGRYLKNFVLTSAGAANMPHAAHADPAPLAARTSQSHASRERPQPHPRWVWLWRVGVRKLSLSYISHLTSQDLTSQLTQLQPNTIHDTTVDRSLDRDSNSVKMKILNRSTPHSAG